MSNIIESLSVGMDSWLTEHNKKRKLENAEWKKVANGGYQVYCINTGKSYSIKVNTPHLFQRWEREDTKQNLLNIDGISMALREKDLPDHLHKLTHDDSKKLALLHFKIIALNKKFIRLSQKAFERGEKVVTFPCEMSK